MALRKNRNGNIEFLRFLFSIAILIWHSDVGLRGYLGVEFFYILTGFFLAKELRQTKQVSQQEPIHVTLTHAKCYILKKYLFMFPVFAVSTLIGGIVCYISGKIGNLFYFIGDFLLLQNYGYPVISSTGVLWYLSALFFSLCVLYPVIRRWYDAFTSYCSLLLFLLISGFLIHNYGSLNTPDTFFGFINTGFCRAIGDISLGAFSYSLNHSLINFADKLRCYLKTIKNIAVVFWLFIIFFVVFGVGDNGAGDGIITIFMACMLAISYNENTSQHNGFINLVFVFMGKLSSILYLNHHYWFTCLPDIMNSFGVHLNDNRTKWVAVGLSIGTSFIVLEIEQLLFALSKKSKAKNT